MRFKVTVVTTLSRSGTYQHAVQQKFTDTTSKGGSHSSAAAEVSRLVCDAVVTGQVVPNIMQDHTALMVKGQVAKAEWLLATLP
jgi:hypothetical protein